MNAPEAPPKAEDRDDTRTLGPGDPAPASEDPAGDPIPSGFAPDGLVIERKLGSGGMGDVYVALDSRLGRRVALKVLPPVLAEDPQRLARFEREARAVAALNHPGIVTVHSVGESGGIPYLTMELIEGRTLKEHIPVDGLPIADVLGFGLAMAEALAAAHGRGIVHRDLKPANVMVGEGGRLKVLDFGLAKRSLPLAADAPQSVTDLTQEGHVLGTVAYMSPEQAEGGTTDARSDLFSLGVMLYELATGRRPFQGATWLAQITAVLRDEPEPPERLAPACPPRLSGLILRCLAKSPEARIASAAEVVSELKAIRRELDHQELLATVGGSMIAPARPIPDPPGRRVLRLALAGALALAVAAGVAWRVLRPAAPAEAPEGPQRLVVIPFANAGEPTDDFFAAGLTDELTRRFAGVTQLRPVAQKSAAEYAGSSKKVAEIARELEVGWVLVGSVERRRAPSDGPGRVRLEARLHRGSDGALVWEEIYDRELEAIFRVQGDVVHQVVSRLLGEAADGAAARAADERPTADLGAYEAFLVAGDRLRQPDRGERELRAAIADLERAVALDPGLAVAWAELSRAHSALHHWSYDLSPACLDAARVAADRALELQPFLPEAHLARGFYYYWGLRDYASALDELQIARQARPNDPEILTALAWIRQRQGHFDEVIALFEQALALNPRDPALWNELGVTCWTIGRYDEADRHFVRSIAIAPEKSVAYQLRAWNALVARGDLEAARGFLAEAPDPHHPVGMLVAAQVLWLARDFRGLLAFVDQAPGDALAITRWYLPYDLVRARAHQAAGEPGKARACYERVCRRLEAEVDARPQDDRYRAALALAYAGLGRDRDAVREAKLATELFPVSREAHEGHLRLFDLAEVYARTGDAAAAIGILQSVLGGVHLATPAILRLDPSFDSLRQDPRFEALLAGAPARPTP